MPDSGNSFTELELAFFRAGEEMSSEPASASDVDEARPSLWARLVSALRGD
jgi:hypothetical protein